LADRRRNHFVPRFLLSRFASRAAGKKSWIWQLSRDREPIEISTRDAAVATDFYGGPETGFEDALAVAETRFSRTLSAIDSGEAAQDQAEGLRELVWNLAVRTRALRKQFENVAGRLAAKAIETVTSKGVGDALAQYIRSDLDRLMDEGISGLSPGEQVFARASLKDSTVREAMLGPAEELIRFLPRLFSAHAFDMLGSQSGLQDASEQGQVEGLSRLLEEIGVPDSFAPLRWEVCSTAPLVLGDIGVWAATEDGGVGSLFHRKNSWHSVYLPISASQLLVAFRDSRTSVMDAEKVNLVSAELSWSHIYCSEISDSFRSLALAIGRGDPIMSDPDLAELVSEDDRQIGEEIVRRLRER